MLVTERLRTQSISTTPTHTFDHLLFRRLFIIIIVALSKPFFDESLLRRFSRPRPQTDKINRCLCLLPPLRHCFAVSVVIIGSRNGKRRTIDSIRKLRREVISHRTMIKMH